MQSKEKLEQDYKLVDALLQVNELQALRQTDEALANYIADLLIAKIRHINGEYRKKTD